MAQSLNTKLDLTTRGTMIMGLSKYGDVMIGDRAFEFYNERNPEDYIQIPWAEVDHIAASVMFGGRLIPRFAIFTKQNGTFLFSTRRNKQTLRAIREYIPAERLLRSPTFFGVIKRGILHLIHRG